MNKPSPLGRFVAFEGGEGAGKSTQAKLLVQALAKQSIETDLTREPGGTAGAEAIRSLLLEPPGEGWGPHAEALLFAAARADHVARRIKPQLTSGVWVICDRFVDSSRAYQGGAGGMGDDAVQDLHAFGSGGLKPDLTILLTLDAEAAQTRLTARDGDASDAIGGRSADYHKAVARAFLKQAEAEPERYAVIDAAGDPGAVHAAVMGAITPLIEEAGKQ